MLRWYSYFALFSCKRTSKLLKLNIFFPITLKLFCSISVKFSIQILVYSCHTSFLILYVGTLFNLNRYGSLVVLIRFKEHWMKQMLTTVQICFTRRIPYFNYQINLILLLNQLCIENALVLLIKLYIILSAISAMKIKMKNENQKGRFYKVTVVLPEISNIEKNTLG